MPLQLGPRRVVAPDGVEWRVGRRWLTDRARRAAPRPRGIASESLHNLGSAWPDVGSADIEDALLLVAATLVIVLILVPVLFFGIDLIILGVVLAGGVIARTVLRQPWVIEANSSDPLTSERRLEWRVRGWRDSGRLIAQVASDLSAGRQPDGSGYGDTPSPTHPSQR
jgi:hypothetical protein